MGWRREREIEEGVKEKWVEIRRKREVGAGRVTCFRQFEELPDCRRVEKLDNLSSENDRISAKEVRC